MVTILKWDFELFIGLTNHFSLLNLNSRKKYLEVYRKENRKKIKKTCLGKCQYEYDGKIAIELLFHKSTNIQKYVGNLFPFTI